MPRPPDEQRVGVIDGAGTWADGLLAGPVTNANGWVRGRWCLEGATGSLRFFAARRDDYLELLADAPPLPESLRQLQAAASPDLVLTGFAGGGGLGLFHSLGTAASPDLRPEQRLGRFVEGLALAPLAGAVWDGGTLHLVPSGAAPVVAAPPGEERASPSQRAAREGGDDPLAPFSRAVEAGQFGLAERQVRAVVGATSAQGQQLLQGLTAARRAERRLRRSPRDAGALTEHAWALYVLGAPASALRHAEAALRLDPSRGCAHALVGLEAWLCRDAAAAEAAYGRARAGTDPAQDIHVRLLGAVLGGEAVDAALARLKAEADALAAGHRAA